MIVWVRDAEKADVEVKVKEAWQKDEDEVDILLPPPKQMTEI